MRALLADIVLVLHFAIAAFIAGGLVFTWLGAALGWQWIRALRFRLAHLAAITFVAAEALFGIVCPLTLWEDALRSSAGERSFVARWVSRLLYHDLPEWVFTASYVAAALATLAAWWVVPPRSRLRG
ncbi:MAG: DUF2784 family protein [Betaproteobacteria bacterium]|nr:DUF2784 family protein [Betaproteobacteria bacterium]